MFQKITLSKAESVQQVEDLDDQNVTTVTSCKTTATASFFEIYNEKVYDLLSDKSENLNSSLAIREDAKKGVYVEDLKEVEVEKTSDAEASKFLFNFYRMPSFVLHFFVEHAI